MSRKFFIYLVSVLSVIFLMDGSAQAVEDAKATDLTVSPAIMEWIVPAGQSTTKEVVAINTTDRLLPVRTFAQGLTVKEKVNDSARAIFDASEWFEVKNPDFILKPKETRKVQVVLKTPSDAQPGGHYATIYFQQLSPVQANAQDTSVVGRVGTLTFITVKGDIRRDIQAASPLAIRRPGREFTFEAPLKNKGNIHVLPTVSFEVKDWRGRPVTKIGTQPGIILPHTERTYSGTWQPPFFGRFTVTPHIKYSNGQKVAMDSVTVWQIPLRWVVSIVMIPLVAWFGVIRIWPRWRKAWYTLWKK